MEVTLSIKIILSSKEDFVSLAAKSAGVRFIYSANHSHDNIYQRYDICTFAVTTLTMCVLFIVSTKSIDWVMQICV